MATIKDLEREIDLIKKRNKKVEMDKAWETSWTRKASIVILTYILIVLFFYFAKLPDPFTNAIVPTIAFLLSTLTLNVYKGVWVKYIYKE